MNTSYGQVKKTLQIGAGVTVVSALAGIIFLPLLFFAAATVIATAVIAAVISSRRTHQWAWTWIAGIASVTWTSSAAHAMNAWGQAFDLSDAGHPVPHALHVTLTVAFSVSVAGFLAVVVSALMSLHRARRTDFSSHGRSAVLAEGAGR